MDEKMMNKIRGTLDIDMLEKINGGGGADGGMGSIFPEMSTEEVKQYVMKVAETFGVEIAIEVAVAYGVPSYEAKSWFAAPEA